MKCSNCKKEIIDESTIILLNVDGDFVCGEKCKKEYDAEKERFLKGIVHSPEKTEAYLLGEL